jgi:fluoroacetyl-CoA thioesterase
MSDDLPLGLKHSLSLTIDQHLTVPAIAQAFAGFSGMPPVFATAYLIAFVEWTCIEAVKPHLASGLQTVGTHVDISHEAPTPVGMTVTAEVELIEAVGRKLRFAVTCRDEAGLIGKGFHDRAIINPASFLARLAKKNPGGGTHV